MVAAELRDVPYVEAAQALIIRNYGPTIARDVHVSFDPPIPDPDPEDAHKSAIPFLKRRYARPVAVLTPGMELDNIWFYGRLCSDGQWTNFEPTSDRFNVRIAYKSSDGTPYVDDFTLDVDLNRERTYATSSLAPERQLKKGVKALGQIANAVTRVAKRFAPQSNAPALAEPMRQLRERDREG